MPCYKGTWGMLTYAWFVTEGVIAMLQQCSEMPSGTMPSIVSNSQRLSKLWVVACFCD